ncbi:hypothetical protein BH11PLA2_BH11PLA2_17810 [soil metagenome]
MFRLLATTIFSMVLLGCGSNPSGRPTVEGTVTYKGVPVAGKTLMLLGKAADGDTISQLLNLDANGGFKGEVPVPGTYKVVIQENIAVMEKAKDAPAGVTLPAKYKVVETSDITWDIVAGSNKKTIELKD